ncbi:F-box protein At5g03100-like [Solanum stenotomum]|uniref:F-box protein At5g03100-like n=1 Tax=Solanum stenotomum TaxID=172797 RepID=UPI0020CFF526|nr:F-box protein At5g03100-like [Solanum stenotomum]
MTGVGETLEDRISSLPDELLIKILSCSATKDAYTTCILSKRWLYLWTSIRNFSFANTNYRENFTSFVNYILSRSVSPKIQKFELDYSYCDVESRWQITEWLNFAATRKVEHLLLWSTDLITSPFPLPQSFCECSSLITLAIVLGRFNFDDTVIAWKSLKSLKLGNFLIDDYKIAKILSGCPVLEDMELHDLVVLNGPHRLEFMSSKLNTLKLNGQWLINDGSLRCVEIFAPYIQHLEISGGLYDLKCILVDVSAVVTAKLAFNIMCIKDINDNYGLHFDPEEDSCSGYHQFFRSLVHGYLLTFRNVKELTIGTWLTEVLCMLLFKGTVLPEMKCKYLTLELHVKRFNLYGVAGLLRASSHVETLNINIYTEALDIEGRDIDLSTKSLEDTHCHFELSDLVKGDDIDLQNWILFGFPNLKNVTIINSPGERCFKDHFKQGFDKLLKLSEFLLNNATVLEKFVISKGIMCKICSTNCVSTFLSQLAEKLFCCPRSSTNCVIIY